MWFTGVSRGHWESTLLVSPARGVCYTARTMSEDSGSFGHWLRRKLVERHTSLAQLCRMAGCDYTYLWRIIHSDTAAGRKYTRPSYHLTRRIGEALDAPLEALAAAGYGEGTSVDDARVADRLARLQQDLTDLRAALDPRDMQEPESWRGKRLPLLGQIQAGELHEALQNPDDWVDVPDFVGKDARFALRVRGDSMSPTLLEGDMVTVKEQPSAEPGQLVVAAVDGEVTLKRYDMVDGVPSLVADNDAWAPVRCGPRVRIVGVVTGSYRPPEVLRRRPR